MCKDIKRLYWEQKRYYCQTLGRNWVELKESLLQDFSVPLHCTSRIMSPPSSETGGVEAYTVADKTLGTLFLPFPHLQVLQAHRLSLGKQTSILQAQGLYLRVFPPTANWLIPLPPSLLKCHLQDETSLTTLWNLTASYLQHLQSPFNLFNLFSNAFSPSNSPRNSIIYYVYLVTVYLPH